MRILRKTFVLFLVFVTFLLSVNHVDAKRMSQRREVRAKKVAEIVDSKWEKYGVLPSVAIAQGIIESGLGENSRPYSWWGVGGGRHSFSTLEAGCTNYLQCINNGYYNKALYNRKYSTQIRHILYGGYCDNKESYIRSACKTIEKYNLNRYDKKLFNRLRKKNTNKVIVKTSYGGGSRVSSLVPTFTCTMCAISNN